MVLIPARSSAPRNTYVPGVTVLTYDDGRITTLAGKPLQPGALGLPRFKIDDERLDALFPAISPSAYKIYCALGRRLGYGDTLVEMSVKEISAATGIKSEHTIRTALNELERELRIITRIGGNTRRKYVLNEMYVRRGK